MSIPDANRIIRHLNRKWFSEGNGSITDVSLPEQFKAQDDAYTLVRELKEFAEQNNVVEFYLDDTNDRIVMAVTRTGSPMDLDDDTKQDVRTQ